MSTSRNPQEAPPTGRTHGRRWQLLTLWLWPVLAIAAIPLVRGWELMLVWLLALAGFIVHAVIAVRQPKQPSGSDGSKPLSAAPAGE